MQISSTKPVLVQSIWVNKNSSYLLQISLVAFGVFFLAVCAKISIPMWPVPITMGTFAVLSLGAIYGPRLGLATILAYLIIGAFGFNVFAGSTAQEYGLAYMIGGTGGYLIGFIFAMLVMGMLARQGWDRSPIKMAGALFLGNVVIYVPGLLWLGVLYGWDKPLLNWGLFPFIIGDLLKLSLAAMVVPAAWKFVENTKS